MEEFDAARPSSGQPVSNCFSHFSFTFILYPNINPRSQDEGSSPIRRLPKKLPTKADAFESPHPLPQRVELIPNYSPNAESPSLPSESTSNNAESPQRRRVTPLLDGVSTFSPKPKRHRSSDNLKSFKVSLEDPTWKVLPAALKKHRINTEDWQSYAMLIFYGPFGIVLALCFFFCLRINVCYRQSGRAVSEL